MWLKSYFCPFYQPTFQSLLSLPVANIPDCLADKLQELLDKAEGPEALPEERKEMEELKALLPEIQEKVEDAMEGLKSASTAAEAVKDVLVSQECKSISKES